MTAGSVAVAGRYLLGETLGVGGMGQVWVARDEILHREVAVKEIILPADLVAAERDAVHLRMLQEARAAARISHPNVAQVYDVFEDDGRAWIVMEYVPSRSLQEVMREDGPLEPRRVARIGLEVLAALEAADRKGVRHRDVKPANVLLGHDGRVVLTDFGIASIDGDSVITTSSEIVLGSPEYMAPERARDGTTEPASDLWSLGATLYAAVEGRSPFQRPSALGTLTALAADEPDPPRRAGPLLPVLEGLLVKDPAARIGMAETRRRLEEAAAAPPPDPDPAASATTVVAETPAAPAAAPETPAAPAAAPETPAAAPAAPETSAAPAATPPAPAVPAAAPVSPAVAPPPTSGVTEPDAARSPRPQSGRPRRRGLLVAAALTVVLLLAGTVAWLTTRDNGRAGAQRPPAASAPAPALPGATATATGTPTTAAPSAPASAAATPPVTKPSSPTTKTTAAGRQLPQRPAGWRDYRDRTGFALYVPEGWTRSRKGSMVYFRDHSTGRVLGIDQTDEPQWDPVADWRGKADYRVARGDFPGYDEIHIREVRYFLKAADWEFTFDGGSRQHVNNRGVVTSAHQAYGIYWQTPDRDWDAARDDLQLIFDSFRPASD